METSVPSIPKNDIEKLTTNYGNLKIGDKIKIISTNAVRCIENRSGEVSIFNRLGIIDPYPRGICEIIKIEQGKYFDSFLIKDENGSIFKVGDGPETYIKITLPSQDSI
jgi:hypothetical protein